MVTQNWGVYCVYGIVLYINNGFITTCLDHKTFILVFGRNNFYCMLYFPLYLAHIEGLERLI